MIGGVATSLLIELIVYPAIFYIWRSRAIQRQSQLPPPDAITAQPQPAH
jgi:Cu(I)/Ag(I) efflux system membrane protein CusA/SilA